MGTLKTAAIVGLLALAGCNVGDRTLENRVRANLEGDPDLSQVGVTANARVVTLTGLVASSADRDRIEERVRRVPGVLAIEDRIRVAPPVTTTGADAGSK